MSTGASVLFMLGLRHLGTARTGAYFSLAPFIGAVLAVIIFRDAVTIQLLLAGLLMGIGIWLHLSERHDHEHVHKPLEHEHSHIHDEQSPSRTWRPSEQIVTL
jgi:drug/metabolite transporter (DMT)-like permease